MTTLRLPPEGSARDAACAILEALEAGRAQSNRLLEELPSAMSDRDRALVTEIVYGVLRRRTLLDRAIGTASRRALADIESPLLGILRVAVYQVFYLTRIPASAAVNEAVHQARRIRGPGGASFANGLLRGLCRARDAGELHLIPHRPEGESGPHQFRAWLAEAHSFPPMLVDRFCSRYGPELTDRLLDTMNQPAPLVLRALRPSGGAVKLAQHLAGGGIETHPSPWLDEALRVDQGVPQTSAAFREGEFYFQDEASQCVGRLLEPIGSEDAFIDVCAAPGGKFLQTCDTVGPSDALLVAADRSLSRLRRLRRNGRRLGWGAMRCVAMDAKHPALMRRFTRVLVDAPCSGTGVIRRHPEIRWRRNEADFTRHAAEQGAMLSAASRILAPGGRLVYAVCSLEPEEGVERIDAALRDHPGLRLLDARELLPPRLHALVTVRGFLETRPDRDDMDGFFAAAMTLC